MVLNFDSGDFDPSAILLILAFIIIGVLIRRLCEPSTILLTSAFRTVGAHFISIIVHRRYAFWRFAFCISCSYKKFTQFAESIGGPMEMLMVKFSCLVNRLELDCLIPENKL